MPLDLPVVPIHQAYAANTHAPMDLSTQLQRNLDSFHRGYITESDIEKRGIIGTTDAQASREGNLAAKATFQQDRVDQQGIAPPPAPKVATPSTPALPKTTARKTGLEQWTTDDLLRTAQSQFPDLF